MNIALFALAILMIVGGVASVIQGFPFVRLESGMAMTVAGATTASAGVVVLGLAAVVSHLRGLGQRLSELRLAAPATEAAPARALAPPMPEPTFAQPSLAESSFAEPTFTEPPLAMSGDRPARQRPSFGEPGRDGDSGATPGVGMASVGMAGLGAGVAAARFAPTPESDAFAGAGPGGRGTEPTFVLPPEPEPVPPPEPEPVEPLLPDLLPPASETAPTPDVVATPEIPEAAEAERAATDETPTPTLFDTTGDAAAEPLRLYPTLDTTAAAPPAPEPEPAVVELAPDVVGTYKSGGNTYVMFSNGSIEAETPRGRFTFGSLDELKDFVRAGGENDARGAA